MIQRRPPQRREAIVITGASGGIGAAFARTLAAPGRTLTLLGRDAGRKPSDAFKIMLMRLWSAGPWPERSRRLQARSHHS